MAAKQIPQINDSLTCKYVNINITLLRAFVALPPGRARRLGCNVIPKYCMENRPDHTFPLFRFTYVRAVKLAESYATKECSPHQLSRAY